MRFVETSADNVIVLPFSLDLFRKPSVEGAEGVICRKGFVSSGTRRCLPAGIIPASQSDETYAICSERILYLAHRQEGAVQLIALWNARAGDGPGGRADFIERAGRASEIIDRKRIILAARGRHGSSPLKERR